MNGEFITAREVAEYLGVSSRSLQRLADAYGQVHGILPTARPRGRANVFSLIAVERIKAAHVLMRDVPGLCAVHAFEALRDEVSFPVPPSAPAVHQALVPVMAELSALRAEMTNLRSEVIGLRTLLRGVDRAPGAIPLAMDDRSLTEPGVGVSMEETLAQPARSCDRTASLQPSLRRLLSDLEAGYTLLEARGEVVLLTPAGQQVRLVDPRTITALIRQGWLSRDERGLHLTAPPLITRSPTQDSEQTV